MHMHIKKCTHTKANPAFWVISKSCSLKIVSSRVPMVKKSITLDMCIFFFFLQNSILAFVIQDVLYVHMLDFVKEKKKCDTKKCCDRSTWKCNLRPFSKLWQTTDRPMTIQTNASRPKGGYREVTLPILVE